MKTVPILVFSFCIFFLCKGNSIDRLKTLDDVKTFLKKSNKNKHDYDFFDLQKKDSTEKLASVLFLKIDLNHDGLTDLIINGTQLFALVDDGTDHFDPFFIDRGTFLSRSYILAAIDSSGKQPKVIVKQYDARRSAKSRYDTLIVKYGGFVEYSTQQDDPDIKEISLSTDRCFGTCPVFNISVDANGTALYDAKLYNKKKGLYRGRIDTSTLAQLFSLARYIHLKTLSDHYKVDWTDDQTAVLKVKFTDGTTKTITDYGEIGTFGLERLYHYCFALRGATRWHKIRQL